MAPTSSPPREDPSSGCRRLGNHGWRHRGAAASEAGTGGFAMGSYDDTIGGARPLRRNLPIVPRTSVGFRLGQTVKLSIVPIGGIHIFIGKPSIPTETLGQPTNPTLSHPAKDLQCHGSDPAGFFLGGTPVTEEMVAQAGIDAVYRSDILNKPITPGDAADPEALEATRKEMLATAKKIANTAAAILDEREEAAHLMDRFERQDREITATLEQVKSMKKEWEVKMTYAQAEADRIIREAIPPRRINFATPVEQQPLATPKDNMTKAAEILKKKNEEIDIDYVRTLVASAMRQVPRWRRNLGVAPHYIPPPSTFNVLLGSSWFDKPWFLSEGKLAAVRIIPSSWGCPTNV
ncbi:hypothetical protein QYE76_003298 [Lolium multiflorum]|uniref:Uncharacterized protein n=1 Tax=Lolium multiflorum TaxID=4521 RepID=A0AAD8W155_LOLMU|nr:hypothetical protein QYE76_003298 [Lolium multiflorum]